MANQKIVIDLLVKSNKSAAEVKKFAQASNKQLESVSKKVSFLNKAFASFAGNLAANLVSGAVTRGFFALQSAISSTAQDFLDFSKAVAEVNSIMPENQKITDDMRLTLIKFSSAFGGTAADQAKAFYQIVSAGITDTAEAMDLLDVANQAAVAGVTNVTTTIDVLTSILAVYGKQGITASVASDVLFQSVKLGKTTMGELGATMGRVTALASSMGITLQDIAGSIAFVAKRGLKTDEAVIGLRQTIASLSGPSEGMRKTAKRLGLALDETTLKNQSLAETFRSIKKATKGSSTELAALFKNIRARTFVTQVIGDNFEEFVSILDKTKNSAGATAIAFEEIKKSASFQFEALTRELRNLPLLFLALADPEFAKVFEAMRVSLKDLIPVMADLAILTVDLGRATLALAATVQDAIDIYNDYGVIVKEIFTDQIGLVKRAYRALTEEQKDSAKETTNHLDTLNDLFTSIENAAKKIGEKSKKGFDDLDTSAKDSTGAFENFKEKLVETTAEVKKFGDTSQKVLDFAAGVGSAEVLEEKLLLVQQIIEEAFAAGLLTQREYLLAIENSEAASFNKRVDIQKRQLSNILKAQRRQNNFSLKDEIKFLEAMRLATEANSRDMIAIKEAEFAAREKMRKQDEDNRRIFLSTAATLSRSSNKSLAIIGKAAAITQIAIASPKAIAASFAFGTTIGGPPLGFILAGIAATAMAAQAAEVAGVPLQTGLTEVPGGFPNDSFQAKLSSGERVLNTNQNADLKDFLSEQDNSNQSQQMLEHLESMDSKMTELNIRVGDLEFNAVIEIDGREIVRATNDQVRSGRRLVSNGNM